MAADLKIKETETSGVRVLHLSGSLDGHTAVSLEGRLRTLINDGHAKLVLDLSHLSFIASAGVGLFINFNQQATAADGSVQLVNPSPTVKEVFHILGLGHLFKIHDSVNDGIAAARG